MKRIRDLIVVAGHAPFKKQITEVPTDVESDDPWELADFQASEPPFYLEHIRRGVVLAVHQPTALLVFSGGTTREAGGWSESDTYESIACSRGWWLEGRPDVMESLAKRVGKEDAARDSFENLLFSICSFYLRTGEYPRVITVVSWAFKATRFSLHRTAIKFPANRFRFDGFNDPIDLESAWRGERGALRLFVDDPYGSAGKLKAKREERTLEPATFEKRREEYSRCPGLRSFFEFIYDSSCSSITHF